MISGSRETLIYKLFSLSRTYYFRKKLIQTDIVVKDDLFVGRFFG